MATVHGGLDVTELRSLGLRPEEVLDFSANINPLGLSQRVAQAAAETDLSVYPDRCSSDLRSKLADRLEIGIENVMIGNGSTELIHLLARSYLCPGQKCLIFAPSFGEYEVAAIVAGGDVSLVQAEEAQGFRWPIDMAIYTIRRIRPSLIFLCNPNNPTGVYLNRDQVRRISRAMDGHGLFVLDDSYMSLADWQWNSISLLGYGNIAVLRSMTKDHALAGARLGYLVAQQSVVSAAQDLQPAWSVNAVAQAVGIAALEDERHVAAARAVISEAKAYLCGQLDTIGAPVTPSAANFVLARVGEATAVRAALLRRRIAVRDCTSFGLPEHIRIAVRRPRECVQLIETLTKVMRHA